MEDIERDWEIEIERDWEREITRLLLFIDVIISVLVYLILVCELLLFLSYFWLSNSLYCLSNVIINSYTSYSYCCNNLCNISSINTLILLHFWISFVVVIIMMNTYRSLLYILSYVIIVLFINLSILEYYLITVYINESIYNNIFLYLIGIHLFHVLLGCILSLSSVWILTRVSLEILLTLVLYKCKVSTYSILLTLYLLYWNLIDILWILIYYIIL
jgi:heme/copper-type cytochrome/quinol oxidase subunit 3